MLKRSWLFRAVFVASSLLIPPAVPAEAAPSPPVAKDPNWYKAALDLHQQALQELARGQADTAIPKLKRALAISEENQSDEYVMLTLGYLVNAYTMKRDTVEVETLFTRKYELAQKKYDAKSPMLAMVLNEFGDFYRQLGQFERAQPMLEQAVAIYAGATGITALGAVPPLNNLANLYVARGELDRAGELLEKALTIQETALGKDHLQLAPTLSNIAVVAHHRGDLARAEEIDRRACAMLEATSAVNGSSHAQCLANLGFVLQSKGDYTAAKELVEKSMNMQRRVLGASHPRISLTMTGLGQIQQAMGDLKAAAQTYEEAMAINDRDLDLVMVAGSESQKRDFFSRIAKQTEGVVSLHLTVAQSDPAARNLALRTILRRKGKVLDAVSQNVSALRERLTGEDAALLDQLTTARTDLARAVLGGAGAPPPGSPQQKQAEEAARKRVDELEKELGKRNVALRGLGEEITIDAVQASLPKDAALIEFIRYRPFNPKWKKREEAFGSAHYAAYVVTASGEPESFDLGTADELDAEITTFRKACAAPDSQNTTALGKALDEKILRPILGKVKALPSLPMGKPRTVFLSPDAALNLVPFAALVDEDGKHRVETFAFDYVTSGRDLLRFSEEVPAARQRPLVLANADFGPRQPKGSLATSFAAYFAPLPGTVEEGRIITALLPGSTLLTEAKAMEETLKALHGPEALHMATHGFFRGEPKSIEGNTRALELEVSNVANSGSGPKTLQAPMDNPLLRSGLAVAGSNLRRQPEDGLLTALEVSSMDLWGTKLVVLSACETGLGDVSAGEGVYGLRRAFAIAGAQTVLMSLWEVDDNATRDLMVGYYLRMAAKEGRAEALRTTQLSLLYDKAHAHPFFWAAFLAAGDPRPVDFAVAPPGGVPKAIVPGKTGCACTMVGHEQPGALWVGIIVAGVLARRWRLGHKKPASGYAASLSAEQGN